MGAHEDWYRFLKRIHDWFRTGMDEMLKDADVTVPAQIRNLGFTTVSFATNLKHHHDLEELFVFPFFSQKVDISHWTAAHEELTETLGSLQSQGANAQRDPSTFDAARFRATVEELRRIVVPHFADEEELSLPERTSALWTEQEFRKLH